MFELDATHKPIYNKCLSCNVYVDSVAGIRLLLAGDTILSLSPLPDVGVGHWNAVPASMIMHKAPILTILLSVLVVGTSASAGDEPLERAQNLEFNTETGEWVELQPPVPGTPDGDLRIARSLHSKEKNSEALKAVKKWYEDHGEFHALYPDAVLLECSVRIAKRDYYKAHLRLQEFLNEFSGTQYENEALNMEFVIAEVFLTGTKRKLWGMRILKGEDIGLNILDDIAANYPGSRIAELATITKADYYFEEGDFPFAEQEYLYLVQNFNRSRYVRPSMLKAARSALASFPGIRFDDAPLIEAEEQFNRYLAQYPASAEQEGIGLILQNIKEDRAAKELSIGRYYLKVGQIHAADFYFKSTITHWPETIAALKAAEVIQEMGGTIPDALETELTTSSENSTSADNLTGDSLEDSEKETETNSQEQS